MFYEVHARFRAGTAAEFFEKLTDGTIQNLQPDGAEMVDSMHRAVVTADGSVEWSEQCFCRTPLAHERATVLDTYFEDLSTELTDGYRAHRGEPFMGYLKQLARSLS